MKVKLIIILGSSVVFVLLSAIIVYFNNAISNLEEDVADYRFDVELIEQWRDTYRQTLIDNDVPLPPTITSQYGYPKLLIKNECYYCIDVDSERMPLPFQQIELNGKLYYLISESNQIMSDATIWDWGKARLYRGN